MTRPRPSGWGESWIRDLLIVVSLSAAARLAIFSGFVGGDDFGCAWVAHEILTGGYPEIGGDVFAARPLLVAPMAASIGLFGWSELALILPVLLASLWGIGCAYALGRVLVGRAGGFLASATLAVFPLDLVYATTTTNDIVGSAVLGTAAVLAVLSVSAAMSGRSTVAVVAGALSGFVISLVTGVKLALLIGWIPFALVMAIVVAARPRTWPVCVAMMSGWACAQLMLIAFFWQTSGEPFKNYTVELGFNRTFLAEPYLATRAAALWSYPSWTFGIQPAFPDNDRFFPYGLFFPLVAVSAVACLRWGASRTWFLVVWCVATLLLLEFWPLQLFPAYIPIHRLPRFLHLAAIPGAVIIGIACVLVSSRGVLFRVAAMSVWLVYAAHGVGSSLTAAERHRDSMKDLRFAASISRSFPGPIVTDAELRGYLLFRRGFSDQDKLRKLVGANARVPSNAMVIVGGGRRIDMDPAWVEKRVPSRAPDSWTKLGDMPGGPRPWRRARGAVYITHGPSEMLSKGSTDAIGSAGCAAGRDWRLVDTIDVGDPASETAHGYEIEGQTFSGERMMFDQNALELEDDGRAFRGRQAFDVSGLAAGAATCIVKRVDASARRQSSRWSVGQRTVGDMWADRESGVSWLAVSLSVAGELISDFRMRFREDFHSADTDLNSYRIEVYQSFSRMP